MILDSETRDWIRMNQGMLKKIVNDRMQDVFNSVVDEEDSEKKQVLSALVKEFRVALIMIENVSSQKDTKKPDKEFTGM